MYAVVYFPEEDSVGVVPESWVTGERCAWPPKGCFKGNALDRAVEAGIPAPADWNLHPAEVLRTTREAIFIIHHTQWLTVGISNTITLFDELCYTITVVYLRNFQRNTVPVEMFTWNLFILLIS